MKRILIVDVGEAYGGIEKYIYNIYNHINAKKISIDFLIFSNHCAYEKQYSEKSCIFRVTSRRKNPYKHYVEMRAFFKTHSYDVIWVQTCSASNITTQIMANKFSKAMIVSHAHVAKAEPKGMIHDVLTIMLHFMNQGRLNKVTDIRLACSKEAAKYLFGKKNLDKVLVVKNGIDLGVYKSDEEEKAANRRRLGIAKDEFVIGHVGRFSKIKNHNFIIKVFYEYHKRNEKSILLLVGDGEEKQHIESEIQDMGLSQYVIFTGARTDIPQLLSAMDMFIFPSINEGFGIAAIEAQAAEVPTLLSDSLSQDLIVSNNCKMMSLKKPIKTWVKEIEIMRVHKEFKYESNIFNFDIISTTRQIEDILGGN